MIYEVKETAPVWNALSGPIRKALSSGQGPQTTVAHIQASIDAGLSQMWGIESDGELKGCVVLAVEVTATGHKKVWIDILAGYDMDEWADELEAVLMKFVNAVGADYLEGSCRPGLARILSRRDAWRKKAVIMELKV